MDEIEQHRARKVYCAAVGQTMRSFHEEALTRHMAVSPGMDVAMSTVTVIRERQLAAAEADKQVTNGNKKNANKKQ